MSYLFKKAVFTHTLNKWFSICSYVVCDFVTAFNSSVCTTNYIDENVALLYEIRIQHDTAFISASIFSATSLKDFLGVFTKVRSMVDARQTTFRPRMHSQLSRLEKRIQNLSSRYLEMI